MTFTIHPGPHLTAVHGDDDSLRDLLINVATTCSAGEWAELRERCRDTTSPHITETERDTFLNAVDDLLHTVFSQKDLPLPTVYITDAERPTFADQLVTAWCGQRPFPGQARQILRRTGGAR